ncbi:transcriptional regulator, CarD family [Caloramator quimbayensis]|uniref:Transcriptional regulator, CarD family n=1 Tax=Caloramator quimbayensis TaxID=1147123 RepID=A0A1T4Y2V6_9CLOT|nr:CarD family transcriptional regulator [Caloramator quimbayensis]SKA96080.1 transcriptional regulator, CarD family [Caloramator quimbayensis]
MFSIGEWIFYPVFGAGLIINIEEKKIFGEIRKYYVIKFINGIDMMVPVYSNESFKLRKAISVDECKEIYNIILKSTPENLPSKWSDRYKYYMSCINEGDIKKLSKIIRDIGNLSKNKKLSRSELNIFNDILNLVSGEICAVLNKDIDSIKREINSLAKD